MKRHVIISLKAAGGIISVKSRPSGSYGVRQFALIVTVLISSNRLLVLVAALMGTEHHSTLVSKLFQALTFLAHSLAPWPLPVCIRAAAEMPGKVIFSAQG